MLDWGSITAIGGGVLFVGALVVMGWRIGKMEGKYPNKIECERQREKCRMSTDTDKNKFEKKIENVEKKITDSNHEIHARIDLVLEEIKKLAVDIARIGK